MKIKIRLELFMLYIIVISMTSFWGIIEISSDIVLIECIIFILYVELKYHKIKISIKYNFSFIIGGLFFLIISSSIRSFQLYSQPIEWGIRAQRSLFVIYIMYFPLTKLLSIRKIVMKDIEKMFFTIGTIQLFIYIIFFLSNGNIKFLKYSYDYRYGGMRLRVHCCIINLLFILSINQYINGINKRKNLFLIIINVLVCALIIKTRLLIASYVIVLIMSVIIWKKNLRKKLFFILVSILIIPIIMQSTIIQDMIDTILENDVNDIRKIGKNYYIESLKDSPIIGRGYINILCEKAFIAAGMDKLIYLVDNGVYAFAFEYGMLGISWIVILWIKILKKSIRKYRLKNDYIGILYLVYLTVLLPNITWWSWTQDGMFCMTIIMSMLNEKRE